jgi:PTS system mannose-specific IID component
VTAAATMQVSSPTQPPRLGWFTWLRVFLRLLAIQGSWNYEGMIGNGIAFCLEPALRHLPGGRGGTRYREALAREAHYFNAHPYLASVAVGALARAELDGEQPERIDRFRTALCGPLGSVGDRLVWAGWLPVCSLVALSAFGAGAGPITVIALFLVLYNAGHFALRIWGLRTGWQHGLRVAQSLGNPVLRQGPLQLGRVGAVAAGIALPLALFRVIGPGRTLIEVVVVGAFAGALLLLRLQGRIEGWRLALALLVIFALAAVAS